MSPAATARPGPDGAPRRGYRGLSLWHDTLADSGDDDLVPRPALDGDTDVDVCIVGGGYTGLWTAYYLLEADPALRVLVVERHIAAFGASGRNGGWCSALFPISTPALARRYGRDAAVRLRQVMNDTVDEVGRVSKAEGIDCHFLKGGSVRLARTPVQLERTRADVADDEAMGGVDGMVALSEAEARARVGASGVLGGSFTPHCARVHPARLARGLARVVEGRGGRIAEQTTAVRLQPSGAGRPGPSVLTDRGLVRARFVIRATEAWTATLPGSERDVVPIYSLMVATEPLPSSFWAQAGLARGETFADERHLIIYGQRTADDRIAFGGRGAPYHYGSRIDSAYDRDDVVHAALRATLVDLFPALGGHAFTHAWGGPLGIARDWHASVGLDRPTGLGWAGGYVGDGVGTANLAGRTLADLVLARDTPLTALPWVGHRSRRWEPEPLRWAEVNAGLTSMSAADGEERVSGRQSVAARMMRRFIGH